MSPIRRGNHIEGVIIWCAHLKCDRWWVQVLVGQTNDYEIDICCFSAKHTALGSESKG